MRCNSPQRASFSMNCLLLSAVGHQAQLAAPRSPSRPTLRISTPLESPPIASESQVLCPRSDVGVEGHEAQRHEALYSPSQRPNLTETPLEEPLLSAVVGHEAQLSPSERSARRKINAASLREHTMKDMNRRGGGMKVVEFQSQIENSQLMDSTAGDRNEVPRFLPPNPWVLHLARDVVKGSAFDEQVRGQLRSSTGQSCKFGRLLDLVDVGTYAKLCKASVHDLVRLIDHRLQNVKVHKKSCQALINYFKQIDELLSSLLKSVDMANLPHGVHRLLGVLKESLADAYILIKKCETRSPIHVNVLSNIPAQLMAVEEEIHRIIPVLRLALAQHQDILNSQANMESVVLGASGDASLNVSTTPNSSASCQRSTIVKDGRSETTVSNGCNMSIQKSGLDRRSPSSACKNVTAWHVDIHHLKMHRWGTRTYLCRACHQLGTGCVFSCDQCNYHVHPSCVELNEAIQQLEEIRINKLSICDDPVTFDRDLCGLVR